MSAVLPLAHVMLPKCVMALVAIARWTSLRMTVVTAGVDCNVLLVNAPLGMSNAGVVAQQ